MKTSIKPPVLSSVASSNHSYMGGFGNEFQTEALPDALPHQRNSPQRCPYGLYAEQISGTAFTMPRIRNRRSWCYRLRPSVRHVGRLQRVTMPYWMSAPDYDPLRQSLGQYRWDPIPVPDKSANLTFITGMRSMTTSGNVHMQTGMGMHTYVATASMEAEFFCSADGEMLILPQQGGLEIHSELGVLVVYPQEFALIPRGIVFRVVLMDETARGFMCENYGMMFELPELGPIGANGLANPHDFLTPCAGFEDRAGAMQLIVKWCGQFHQTELNHSPLDVVAWRGNYAPCKYDLNAFSPIGSVCFDHPDPSIFTLLTSPSCTQGVANVDFVLFSERWLVAENTFRPPWYHKNVMSEFMGNLCGQYDAKPQGFPPGGMSLHNMMLPHGPDTMAFESASRTVLTPEKLTKNMAFMLETKLPQHLTAFAAQEAPLQPHYPDCWTGLKKRFDGTLQGDWS